VLAYFPKKIQLTNKAYKALFKRFKPLFRFQQMLIISKLNFTQLRKKV